MAFEFDPKKSQVNLIKHGIDFEQAQKLWDDPMAVQVQARTSDELRFMVVGKIGGTHWSSIITYRAENIRVISVRRSRKKEVALYESF